MARLSVLILAAIVAALLLAAEFYGPFAFQRSAGYGRGWGDVCGWLTKPIPMALVTLGASLALPRDGARLPVVVNLAVAAAAYLWLLTGLARRHAAKAEA